MEDKEVVDKTICMSKDWTGNGNSIFKTLGASNHTDEERQVDDYYATDPTAIDKLASVFRIPRVVWECACGEGYLSTRLLVRGHTVMSSDLVDRGYGLVRYDFLKKERLPEFMVGEDCCILTNPPYKYATEFVEHALELLPEGAPAIFLLKTTALEGKKRWERLYKHGYLHEVYQFTERLLCAKNGDFDKMKEGGGQGSQLRLVCVQEDAV